MLCGPGLAACAQPGQSRAEVALFAAGTEASSPFEGRGGVEVSLREARLAFGPFTLCAGYQAGELCEAALAEWSDAAVVDALDPEPSPLGTMEGVTGIARSFMYDLGRVSLLTAEEPLVTEAASSLGGASVRLRGSATRGAESLDFEAELPIEQGAGAERGVPVVRSGVNEAFERELYAEGEAQTQTLTLRFDPRAWLSTVDFDSLLAACAEGGGCAEPVRFEEGDQGWLSVRNGVVVGDRPALEWGAR